ncbi:hypothetical protein GSI_10886 [Ganoderma sinense ZZ0214-1]|uniref:Uncharacterized protein n=1 Tax=Ganoderma sinense ZZ0214-1 TaxID=1077348 RepID=A0A2G8S1T2_9APHY|nr:hypothetical protein GSI_10886 [Ganoderma sinense ZZ0214-1]
MAGEFTSTETMCRISSFYHGFSLSNAYKREYRDLSDADFPAWPASIPVAAKLAIVFCFPGSPRYHRQVHIRRTDSGVLTRGKLATIVAREVQRFLGQVRRAGNQDPLGRCGVHLALENFVLVDVQHVSKGSLQPTIGIIAKSNE